MALLLAVSGAKYYHIHYQYRLGTVTQGVVYQSGAMPPARMAAVAHRLGLRTVIDLRTFTPGQDATNTTSLRDINAEDTALAEVGVRHIYLPTPQVPTAETVAKFLAVVRDPANRPTLIHCYHGIGRTELFVALYRMEFEGWSNQRAREGARFFLPYSSFSDNSEKGRFLIAYHPHPEANLLAPPTK
jgi:protein tyrosine/serine phosphatase